MRLVADAHQRRRPHAVAFTSRLRLRAERTEDLLGEVGAGKVVGCDEGGAGRTAC